MLLIRRRKFACANGDDPRRTSLREHYAPAANAPHPFSILFYVFPPRLCHVYVCPADYQKRGYAAVCLLCPPATVAKYRSTRVTLEYLLPSCLSVLLLHRLLFLSLPPFLPFSLSLPPSPSILLSSSATVFLSLLVLAASPTRMTPLCHEQVLYPGDVSYA